MKRLVVASTNAGKIREVTLALSDLAEWSVESLPELPEFEETGSTFLENAVAKARHYSQSLEGWTLADDSGLCVDALGGQPGVHTARWGTSTQERNQRVLTELAAAGPQAPREAAFVCAFAVALRGEGVWSFESQLLGEIAGQPEGSNGFGFDPIFLVPGKGRTLAQMTAAEKDALSPRGHALRELRQFLQKH